MAEATQTLEGEIVTRPAELTAADEKTEQRQSEQVEKDEQVEETRIKPVKRVASVEPHMKLSAVFDGESDHDVTTPDIEFSVPGLQKPLQLHSCVLTQASALVCGVLKCQKSGKFEWPFDTTNTKDRDAVVKVLRFFYGETLKVETQEVCAVVAALWRFQAHNAEEVSKQLINFAAETATHDLKAGINMLRECVGYQECCDARCCELDRALARVVLSKQNMEYNFDKVVKGLLFELPPWILSKMEYGEPHTRCSELAVRLLYVAHNKDKLSEAEQSEVVGQVDSTQLNSEEIEHLRGLGLFTADELLGMYAGALKELEKQRKKAAEKWAVGCLWMGEHVKIDVAGVFWDGSVLIDSRQLIVRLSSRGILVTRMADATHGITEFVQDVVPFLAPYQPVFDGTNFLYLFQVQGRRFGRVDIDTWEFEEMPPLPEEETFNKYADGCWHRGSVFMVSTERRLCEFNVEKNQWHVHIYTCHLGLDLLSDEVYSYHRSLPYSQRVKLMSNPGVANKIYSVIQQKYHKGRNGKWVNDVREVDYTTGETSSLSVPLQKFSARNMVVIEWLDNGFSAMSKSKDHRACVLSTDGTFFEPVKWGKDLYEKVKLIGLSHTLHAFYYHRGQRLFAVLLPH